LPNSKLRGKLLKLAGTSYISVPTQQLKKICKLQTLL